MFIRCAWKTVGSLTVYNKALNLIPNTTVFSWNIVQQFSSNTCLLKNMTSGSPVESAIRAKIEENLKPTYLQIINESYMHNVPPGSETHFKVVVVAEAFSDLPLIKRHRLVNATLSEELATGVHALSIVAKTPSQWSEGSQQVERSPACRGGFGK